MMVKEKPSYKELELKIKKLEHELFFKENFEKDVKRNNLFLETLFDTIPNPIFYKDINGVYTHCNDSFSGTILGLKKEEVFGKTLYDLSEYFPKEYADIYAQKDKNLFSNPGIQFYEGKVKCADGVIRDFHFYKSTFNIDGEVQGIVGIMLDITEYKNTLKQLDEKNKILNNLSITDYLTGLNNRRYFEDVFERNLGLLNRFEQNFSFALIDIDFFKKYNDSFGHSKGDIVLQKVANCLKKTFARKNDFVFRLGGEEFGILFNTDTDIQSIAKIEDLKKNIENLKLEVSYKKISKYLTVSIGLTTLECYHKEFDLVKIYKFVDDLLYESKQNGRNQVTFKKLLLD